MRKPILPLLVALSACGEGAREYAVIEDFLERSAAVRCEAVDRPLDVAVTELRTATDSTILVLDEPGRRIHEFDDRLRPVWTLDYPAKGPGSLDQPVSVTLLGDSAVAVAERGRLRLVVLARSGDELRTESLDFLPNSVEATAGGELLVTPVPLGDRPPTLLLRYGAAGFHPLDIRPRDYPDMMIEALGNSALVETLPDGAALVVHQFLAPRAFRVEGDAVTAIAAPTPDATLEAVDFVPSSPVTEEQLPRLLVPGMALSVDGRSGDVYLLTRSGRRMDARPERAILRLDGRLGYLQSFTIDVPAARMAFLPRRGAALVVDDEDRFYLCPLPLAADDDAVAE